MLMPLQSKPSAALQFAHLLPYGAIVHDGGVQFAVFSRSATAMRVLLYDSIEDHDPSAIIHTIRNLIAGAMCGVFLYLTFHPDNFTTCKRMVPMNRRWDIALMGRLD